MTATASRTVSGIVAGTLSLFAFASPPSAHAASFDCSKARAADEIAVCRDPTLSGLDSEMGGLWYAYSQFPFLMGMSGARRDAADAFLKTRASCGNNAGCLQNAYRARIGELRAGIKSAIADMQKQIEAAGKR